MSEGFTDLRLNAQEGQVQESFWPSFTDIMTTVVMIFLIALVVLLVRNLELVNQLRSTMEAERIAAELARATGEEKDSLSFALHQAESRVEQLRLEIQRLQEKGVARETVITDQLSSIADLTGERDKLVRQVAQLALLRKNLETDLSNQEAKLLTANTALESRELELNAARSDISNLKVNLQDLQASLDSARATSSELQDQLARQDAQIDSQRRAASEAERKFQSLSGDYDSLKVKYDKLIRPARSAAGHHLIEVRYSKEQGDYLVAWREGSTDEFQPISRKQLDLLLTRLKREHAEGLYVRVIFPEDAGLSYNEAWEFTSHLHRNYDYYFSNESSSDTATKATP